MFALRTLGGPILLVNDFYLVGSYPLQVRTFFYFDFSMPEQTNEQRIEEQEDGPDDPRAFRSMTLDGNVVITNHDLESLREDENARGREEAFRSGKLRRFNRINMSGGID